MQQRFDGTSGYFNDVPYFTPVETTLFYEAVQNCRLHKLPGHLMVNPRSVPFFVKPGTVLMKALGEAFDTATGTRTKSANAVLPDFKTDFSLLQSLFKKSGSDYIAIRETCDVGESSTAGGAAEFIPIYSIDVNSISQIWTGLLLSLHGCPGAPSKFSVRYADIALAQSTGCTECLLSFLLAGIASILHYYSEKEHHQAALEGVLIEFVVLNTAGGASIADKLQFFVENRMKLSATRSCANDFESFYSRLISGVHCVECSDTAWLETVCNETVDAHEILCDQGPARRSGKFLAPIVLLVVPHIVPTRLALATQILDSYSSEPLRVQTDHDWHTDELNKPTPVVFICSSAWLVSQLGVSEAERLLDRLDVSIVIHGGFCEIANTLEEEVVQCMTILQMSGTTQQETRAVQLQTPSFVKRDVSLNSSLLENELQTCGSTLLLLFRRFVMRFSPDSRQPYTIVTRDLFLTQQAWDFFSATVRSLRVSGIMAAGSDVSPEALEMSVLGRFLSFRFRIGNPGAAPDALTLADGKAILWSYLLRQPLTVPQEITRQSHTFHSWVDAAIVQFCNEHRLNFDFHDSLPQKNLVEQLAQFGFCDGVVQSRVHYLLSSPSGTRFPLRPHFTGAVPTVCRGWYEQAPLNAGLALEKKEVAVVCLPPKAMYCELEAAEKASGIRLQCPLELSYPVLVAHSVFHISLHNTCVFSETTEPNVVMPLPANLLESGVMQFLMSGVVKGNTGGWLDGVMAEITPAISDSSVLAPLTLKGSHYIQYCEREVFTRKRRRVEVKTEKPSDGGAFQGMLPRTAAERSAVEELVELIRSIGREKAERVFRGKKGFNFLETAHELHPFYLYSLTKNV